MSGWASDKERADHFENLCRRIREAGGWADEFDNTPYLASCLRAERNAYREELTYIERELHSIEGSGVRALGRRVSKILKDWP
jgi:hypothetical protein